MRAGAVQIDVVSCVCMSVRGLAVSAGMLLGLAGSCGGTTSSEGSIDSRRGNADGTSGGAAEAAATAAEGGAGTAGVPTSTGPGGSSGTGSTTEPVDAGEIDGEPAPIIDAAGDSSDAHDASEPIPETEGRWIAIASSYENDTFAVRVTRWATPSSCPDLPRRSPGRRTAESSLQRTYPTPHRSCCLTSPAQLPAPLRRLPPKRAV